MDFGITSGEHHIAVRTDTISPFEAWFFCRTSNISSSSSIVYEWRILLIKRVAIRHTGLSCNMGFLLQVNFVITQNIKHVSNKHSQAFSPVLDSAELVRGGVSPKGFAIDSN
ncbi:hypothetical protein C5167_014591 [Papaver somniferum]|uniref:Uncharacterized protein n=1 Tax=Papaver somniferum TaxID=3469 RepID=A0A4Y7J3N0_PAPSO|nr:hypothetical protein C5167_014591 [Papaver somniferum]